MADASMSWQHESAHPSEMAHECLEKRGLTVLEAKFLFGISRKAA